VGELGDGQLHPQPESIVGLEPAIDEPLPQHGQPGILVAASCEEARELVAEVGGLPGIVRTLESQTLEANRLAGPARLGGTHGEAVVGPRQLGGQLARALEEAPARRGSLEAPRQIEGTCVLRIEGEGRAVGGQGPRTEEVRHQDVVDETTRSDPVRGEGQAGLSSAQRPGLSVLEEHPRPGESCCRGRADERPCAGGDAAAGSQERQEPEGEAEETHGGQARR